MLSKAVVLTSVAALAGQSLAFNSHRHLHEADKRALKIVYETVWTTVTVTEGDEPTSATSSTIVVDDHPSPVYATPTVSTIPTVTSTSTIVLPSTTQATYEAPAPPPAQQTTDQQTTLYTAIKPSAAQPGTSEPPAPQPESSQQAPSSAPPAPQPESSQQAPSSAPPAEQTAKAVPEPASPHPSGGSPFSSKRGMAYNDPNLANTYGNSCNHCAWAYNWGSDSGSLNSKYSYVPMLWSPAPVHSGNWDYMVNQALGKGCKAIVSFNEPDNAGQANMSPEAAASAHAQFMNKYAGKVLVGAPSITNSGNPGEGVAWLKSFMDACRNQPGGCQVDFCPVHWYSPAQYANTLFDHLEAAHQACGGKPVWLTEFAPFGSDEDISTFLRDTIPKLESLPYLQAYSYFMVSQGSLMASSNSPSKYGSVYATV